MSWQLAVFAGLVLVIAGGFAWYERSRPPARLVALVAALAALAVAGRLVLAPIPNVVATTDIALITGYALGPAPGFAVGALAAPISNIWLGQGPWTAWEMAGWGLVGLAGAWLAVLTHRRLGRLGLAAFCALAGLGYGLLLDLSVMVTYGGEQSLDRYLALSARGLPFNIAHAIGNFTIALAAGPALVRMISRYRTRMEFQWRPAPVVSALVAAIALAAGAATLGTSEPAAAKPAAKSSVDDARTWLVRSQGRDGGFAATPDNPSSPAMTGWAMLGLEAGGRNPLDVSKRGKTPVSYLRSEADRLRSPGDLERTILALDAAGVDPRKFADANLVNELRSKRRRDGSVAGQVNLTAFYVLAMRAADAGKLGRPSGWLRKAQNEDGGWGFRPGAASDADSTGAALQALAAAGSGGKTTKAGVRWLRRAQRSGGGWALATSGVVNSQSTAWAIQGLVAAGSGRRPIDKGIAFLKRLRESDGHFRYSRSSDQTPIWVTSQALLALAEKPFPLARVARRPSSDGSGSDSGSSSGSSSSGSTSSAGSTGSSYPSPSYPSTDSSWDTGTGSTGAGLPSGTDFSNPSGAGSGASSPATGTSTAGEATTAAKDEPGETSIWGALWAEALRNGAEQEGAETEGASGEDPAAAAETATEEYTPAADVSDEPVAPFVGAGFAALILALGAGFVWYRRRLP